MALPDGHPPPFVSRALRKAVEKGALSETTLQNYENRLNLLQQESGLTVHYMLRHPEHAHAVIVGKSGDVPQTVRSYITAFLTLFRHDRKLRERHDVKYQAFKDLFRTVDKVVQDRYNSNAPTERQRDVYMPWSDVLAKRDALVVDATKKDKKDGAEDKNGANNIDRLIICLYTMIPPLRADFGNVRILTREPLGKDGKGGKDDALSGNYLVVRDTYMRLVLNEFKSKSRRLPQYSKVLPAPLDAVIRASLIAHPRRHLLVSPRTNEPFLRDNTYVVYVHRVFERVLGKKVSISMMRHIFVNSLDFNTMTSGQKCQLAADMLHSTTTNDRYRLIF